MTVDEAPNDARPAMLVFMVLLLFYLPTANWNGPGAWTDTFAASVGARQIAMHGLPVFASADAAETVPWVLGAPGGELVVARLPGAMYFAAPFYMVMGREFLTLAPATAAAVVSTALGAVLLGFSLRKAYGTRVAVMAALTIGLGTPAWGIAAQALWTHGPSMMWLGLTAMAMSRDRLGWAGAALGAAVFTRPDLAFIPLVASIYLGWKRLSLRPVLKLSLAAWGILAHLGYGRIAFGVWSLGGVYDTFMEGRLEQLRAAGYGWRVLGTLVSPTRGVLLHTPLVLAAFVPAAWRRAPDWLRALALGSVVSVAGARALEGFSGGTEQETYRYALEAVAILLLVVVPWWLDVGRAWIVSLLLAISVAVQVMAAVFDGPYPDDVAEPGFGLGDWVHVPDEIWAIAAIAGAAAAGVTIAAWNLWLLPGRNAPSSDL